MGEAADATGPNRPATRTTVITLVVAVTVGVIVFGVVFPQLVDWDTVVDVLGEVSGWELALLVLLGLGRFVPAGWIYALVLPGLGLRRGMTSWIGTTALASSTPGLDIPLRFGMYASWGYPVERTTSAMFLSGVVEMSTKYALAVLGVGLWAVLALDETLLVLTIIGVAILAVGAIAVAMLLRSEQRARRFARGLERAAKWLFARMSRTAPDDIVDRVLDARLEARHVLGSSWHKAFAASAATQAIEFAILLLAIRSVGIDGDVLAWYDILLAQGVVIILTTVPITPGNFGIAEMIYVAVFTALAGRASADEIAAGVVLSRLTTWLLPIPIGWLIALRWQTRSGSVGGAGAGQR